jgi:hypothetical protein
MHELLCSFWWKRQTVKIKIKEKQGIKSEESQPLRHFQHKFAH